MDPDQTARIGAVLSELERLLKHFSRRQKQSNFVVIGALRVNRAKQLNRRRQIRLVCPVNVRRKLKSYLFTDTLVIYYCSLVRAS